MQFMGLARSFFVGNTFRKCSKNLLRKLRKMHYFSIFFQKNLTNHALNFCAFRRKRKLLGNFEKILKIFDENSIGKWNLFIFYFYFGKFVTKNRAFGNNTIFYNNFFGFGGISHISPCLRPRCN